MKDHFLNKTGLTYVWNLLKQMFNQKVNTTDYATDTTYGIVKTNSAEAVTLNADGQLDVGGRLGQFTGTTGVYSPKTISPKLVDNGSFLLTEASGTTLGAKSLAVTTGFNITCRSAAAGATVYRVTNTYANRLSCAILLATGGVLALNEAEATKGNFANVQSVQINGAAYVPDSSANKSGTANDIVITVDKTVNPSAATTKIRAYGVATGFSSLLVGQGVATHASSAGASVVVGQKVTLATGAACALVGADIYNTGNGNAVFGRLHISRKNRSFLSGTGHDTTNAKTEAVAAVGEYSLIDANTLFAVGNGTSQTVRKNAFEVLADGFVILSPNGKRYKVSVDDSGNLTTSALS